MGLIVLRLVIISLLATAQKYFAPAQKPRYNEVFNMKLYISKGQKNGQNKTRAG